MQMTTLLTIKQHHMSLHCGCGHSAMVSVKELLDRLKPETTVRQVASRAKCKKCDTKAIWILGCIGSAILIMLQLPLVIGLRKTLMV
jgi:hypothetical protein